MKSLRSGGRLTAAMLMVCAILLTQMMVNAGKLEPPGPPAPTMKTLTEIEPRTALAASAIPTFPHKITESGSYYLTGNRSCQAHGILVLADDVSIDLNGFALTGSGIGDSNGVFIAEGLHNVTIRNGTIKDFGNCGVLGGDSGVGHRLEKLRISSNRGSGVYLAGTTHVVSDCSAGNNDEYGIYVGASSRVIGCTATSNDDNGIEAEENSIVSDCIATGNEGQGIYARYSTVANCVANHNRNGGIQGHGLAVTGCSAYLNTDGPGISAYDSTIIGCTVNESVGAGGIGGSSGTVAFCTANHTHEVGILTSAGGNVIGCTTTENQTAGIKAWGTARIESCSSFLNDIYGVWLYGDDAYAVKNLSVQCNMYSDPNSYMPTDLADTDLANYYKP